MGELNGQTYLVTGASKGIGRSIALTLAGKSATVLLLARPSEALSATTAEVQALSTDSVSIECDLATPASIDAAVALIKRHAKQLDGLVHNAGDIEPIKPIFDADQGDWNRSLMVNLLGVQQLTAGLSPLFEGGHRVRVTTISSGAALRPLVSWSAYCTAKAGLDMWTRCLAAEGASMNISAVSVAPGIVDTAMQATIRSATDEDFPLRGNFVGYHEDGQLSSPDEVANKLLPLICEQTMNESGQRFDVRDL